MAKSVYASIDEPHVWYLTNEHGNYFLNWIYVYEVDYSTGYYYWSSHYERILHIEKHMFVTENESFFDFPADFKQNLVFLNKNRIYGIVPLLSRYDKEHKIYQLAI